MADKKAALKSIFSDATIDEQRYAKVSALSDPTLTYMIAMTPRSGSSHLCDVLKNSKRLGRPGEMLSGPFLPNILKSAPAKSPDEYLKHILRVIKTPNGISGIKASWFQFNDFSQILADPNLLRKFRFIYLTRRDIYAQAVSLYCATSSNVFHTNKSHESSELAKLQTLQYDYDQIQFWKKHIEAQEVGWVRFFMQHNIYPLCITYEEIEAGVTAVALRIARYLSRPLATHGLTEESIFQKIGDRRNVEWACRFRLEFDEQVRNAALHEASSPQRASTLKSPPSPGS